jgi:Ca-activated chloride channel family protein
VSTTTFGVGRDFDEMLLQAMADAGGGNFYFIADAAAIADYVTSEVGEALEVVARDVTLQVTAGAGVTVESLTPYPTDAQDGGARVRLGSLVADQVSQAVLRLNFPFGDIGRETEVRIGLSDRDGALAGVEQRLTWEYADGRTNDLQPRDRDVDQAVARIFSARARQEATGLNRRGDYPAAAAALSAVAKRIRGYAAGDQALGTLVAALERDATEMAAPMAAMELKERHFASYNVARTRTESGQARRAK